MSPKEQDETRMTQLTLPGLELDGDQVGPTSALRRAVTETLAELSALGLLERRHVGMAQLALELADAVTKGNRAGRASAAAMAAAQLREVLQALPAPAPGTLLQEFESFRAELAAAGRTGG